MHGGEKALEGAQVIAVANPGDELLWQRTEASGGVPGTPWVLTLKR